MFCIQFNLKKNSKRKYNSQLVRGFTLIEVLIYIAIMGSVMTGLIIFNLSIATSRNKTASAEEVQVGVRNAFGVIRQKIRSATGVNTGDSIFGANPGQLSLVMADSNKNPTIIDVVDGILRVKEGTNEALPVTGSDILVSNLIFTDVTSDSLRENIRIQMTARYRFAGDISFSYTQTLQGAVSVRQ